MKPKGCIFSPRARQDLGDILSYIGKTDPENALAFVNRLRTTCKRLSRLPESGRARGDLGQACEAFLLTVM